MLFKREGIAFVFPSVAKPEELNGSVRIGASAGLYLDRIAFQVGRQIDTGCINCSLDISCGAIDVTVQRKLQSYPCISL